MRTLRPRSRFAVSAIVRLARSAVPLALVLLIPRATAQTVLVFDTLFQGQNLSQWGSGAASGVNYSVNLGTSWKTSASFGSFSTGLFGDEWGAGGTASTSGNVGFNASLSTNGGSVDVYIPNRIRIEAPKDSGISQPTISVTQDRGSLGANDLFQASFPTISFGLGFHATVDARVEGRIAYGVGSTSGSVTLRDLFAAANPTLYAASQATGLDPFNFNLNLIQFDGPNSTLTLAGKTIHVTNGINKDITTKDVVPVENSDTLVPVQNRLGSVRIDPFFSDLNVHSGSSLSTTAGDTSVFGASLDALGLVSAAFGLPINPFDIRANIPGTPIGVEFMTLSLNPHLDLGLKQSLALSPRTYLTLTSNYDVTYSVNGQTITTKNLNYLLPDDASLTSSLQILTRPTESDWQLFSSIYADPQLHNQLYLTVTGGLDIEALKARLSAYGAGVGFGPLFDLDPSYTQDILVYDQIVDLMGGTLSRVYHNPIPLFGAGVLQNLTLDQPTDAIVLLSQIGQFGLTQLAGDLTLRDSYVINADPIILSGRLHLDLTQSPIAINPDNPGTNDFSAPALTLTSTGTLQIDPNSRLTVTGLKDANNSDTLDAFGNRQLGFITGTGNDKGSIDAGTFLLGGTLSYDGPWITRIGSAADVELLPSTFIGSGTFPDLGRRFNNYRGASTDAAGVDGLTHLDTLAGTLVVAGQDLALINNLVLSGSLTVTNGHTLTASQLDSAATGRITVGPGSLASFSGLNAANLNSSTLTLSNLNLVLGGDAGTTAGVLRYNGGRPASLAASTAITLSGDRPAIGYLQGGLNANTDALADVTANAGALTLQNGATQTVGGASSGGLTNTGSLTVDGANSALAVNGALANTGTLTLARTGALTATGTLTNLGGGTTLTGGTWNVGGLLSYTGNNIATIASGTTIALSGTGGFRNAGANALTSLATLDGTLDLASAATASTNSALTVNGALDLADGTTFTANGLNLAGTLGLAGTLRNNGAALTVLATGATVTVRGAGTLQDAAAGNGWAALTTIAGTLDLADGGAVRTDAALTLASNAQVLLGSGGRLQAAGPTFTLADTNALVQNGGTLILGGNTGTTTSFAVPAGYSFNNLILQLGTGTGTAAALTGTGAWTISSAANVNGAGSLSGGMLVNRGYLGAVGGDLTLSGFSAPIVNAGHLGSYADTRGTGNLVLDNVTLVNHEGTASGVIDIFSGLTLLDGTSLTGGKLNVYAGGTLTLGNATLALGDFDANGNRTSLGTLALDGAATVLADKTARVTAATTVGTTGSLTLQGESSGHTAATLALGTDATLTNRGTVNLGSGAAITGALLDNFGTVNLTSGLVHLDNIANGPGGTISLLDGSTLNFDTASFSNAGLIHLSGEDPSVTPNSASTFLLTQDLTLTGGGTIQLGGYNTSTSANSANVNLASTVWTNAGSGSILTDGANHHTLTLDGQQIIGRGDFGAGQLTLVSHAGSAIGVYGDGSVLNIETDSGGFLNEGTLNVGPGATLNLSGGPFLSLDANGYLVKGSYRVGGTLVIPGLSATAFDSAVGLTFEGDNPRIQNENGDTIQIRNNLPAGALTVSNGTYTFATDASHTFTNQGFLRAAAGGTLAITGGHFGNFDAATHTLSGGSYESAGTFKFDGADLQNLAAGTSLTIRETSAGTGVFTNESGQDALRNFSANHGTFALQGGADYTFNPGIAAFTNDGHMHVGADSYLNLTNAALTHTANSDWWVAGNVSGGSGFTTTGQVTLFGPFAAIQSPGYTMDDGNVPYTTSGTTSDGHPYTTTGSPQVFNQGHLVFAGGYSATFGDGGFANGATINNNGFWEIGSPGVRDADGNLIASAASVSFTGGDAGNYTARIINGNGASVSYYGAVGDSWNSLYYGVPRTSDGTTGSFTVDHLTIQGGGFDAAGLITVNAGGSLAMEDSILRDSQGQLTVYFKTPGSTFEISGGLDLTHPINIINGTLNFSHSLFGNFPVGISGFDLYLPGYDYSTADYSLRNGAHFLDGIGLGALSALRNIQSNYRTVTFDHASGAIGGHKTYDLDFTNTGTINSITSDVSFGGKLDNYGNLTTTGGGAFGVVGDLNNHGTINGTVTVGGDLVHYGGTLSAGGTIGGNLYLAYGSTVPLNSFGTSAIDNLAVGGYVDANVDLTLSGVAFRRDNGTYATIYNSANLTLLGSLYNNLIQDDTVNGGTIHTSGDVSLYGANTALAGKIYVDSGSLSATSDTSTGTATINLADGTTLDAGYYTLANAINATGNVTLVGGNAGGTITGALNGSAFSTGSVTVASRLTLSTGQLNTLTLSSAALTVNAPILTLNGPVTGTGTLTFYGDARPIGWDGGLLDVYGDLTIATLTLATATGSPQLVLHGDADTLLTADIVNPGSTRIATGSDLTLNGALTGGGTLEIGSYYTSTPATALTLTRSTTLSSTTIDRGATLTLNPANDYQNLLTGAVTNNGTLVFASDYAYTQPADQTFTGYGVYQKSGAGLLTLLDATLLNTGTPFALDAGSVRVGNGALNVTGTLGNISSPAATVASGATLAFQNAGTSTLTISGEGRFDNLGSGTTSLSLAGSFSAVNQFGSGTLSLIPNLALDGPVKVGASDGSAYPGFTGGGGTLAIWDDTSLGAAPATFTAGYLTLGSGTTLKILNATTLAATRGVSVTDATIDTNGSTLTIPSHVSGYGTLTKTGFGTLNLFTPGSLNLDVQKGVLNLTNDLGYAYFPTHLAVATDAVLKLNGGAFYISNGDSNGPVDGNVTIASDASLDYQGPDAPGAFTVAGSFLTSNDGHTFGSFANSGALTFGRAHDTGTTTVGDITGAGTVTLDGEFNALQLAGNPNRATLVVTGQLGAGTFNLGDETILQARSGTIGTLNLGANYSHNTIDIASGDLISVDALTGPLNNSLNTTLTKLGEGSLLFNGAGDLPGIKFDVADGVLWGANGTTFNGLISGAGAFTTGYASLTGDVTLTSDNTYTGGTEVFMGRLILGNGGTTGSVVGDIDINSWGTLAFNRSDTHTLANTLTGPGGVEQLGTGTLALNSDLSWTNESDPDHPLTYNRPVTITGGTVRLDDGAAGLGTITDNAALVFNNTAALDLANSGFFGGDKNITGTGTVTQAGAGTTTLGGVNDWTGATAVNAGQLVFTSDFANSGGIAVASGATLGIAGSGDVHGAIANNGTVALDRTDTYVADFTTSGSGKLVKNGAGDAYLASPDHTNAIDIEAGRLGFNSSSDLTFATPLGGPGRFFQNGSGALTLTGGTWTTLGGVDIDTGATLRLANGDYDTTFAIASGGVLSIAQDMSFGHAITGGGRLVVENGRTFNLTGSATQGYTTIDSGATLALADGSTLTGAITNNGVMTFNNLSPYTFAGTASGTGSFLIQDSGRVELTGNSSLLTGGVTIGNTGHLALSGAGSVGGTIANAGTLEIVTTPGDSRLIPANITGAGNLQLSGGGAIEIAGDLAYSGATYLSDGTTLNAFINDGETTTFSSLIYGTGNLVKSGPGTLVIAYSSTFNGAVTINAGTMEISDNGYLFANSLTVNGTLAYNYNTTAQTITAPIAGVGGLRQMGSKPLTIDADLSAFIGTTTVDAGTTLIFGSNGQVGGAFAVDGSLYNTRDAALSLPGLTGGANGLFANSSSETLTLTGPTDFAGTLTTPGALVADISSPSHRLDRFSAASLTNSDHLTITGNNNANRGIAVTNTGWLTLGDGGADGSVGLDGTIANSGILTFNRTTDLTLGYGLNVTGTGTLAQIGASTLTIGPAVAASNLDVSHGTMVLSSGFTGDASTGVSSQGDGVLMLLPGTPLYSVSSSGYLLVNTAGGDLILNHANLTGGIDITGSGALSLPNVAALTLNHALSGTGNLQFNGSTLTLNADNTHTGSILMGAGAFGTATIAGDLASTLNFSSPGGTVNFTNAGDATFTGTLINVAAVNFNGSGDAIVETALATPATLNAGTLTLASGGSLTALTVNHGAALLDGGSLGSLTLANTDASLGLASADATLSALSGSAGSIDLGAHTLTLNQSTATSFAGTIAGTGGFVKSGAGTFGLEGDNTFTGSVNVASGSLALRGTNTASAYSVASGATLFLNSADNLGAAPASLQADLVTLHGGTLDTENSVTLATTQGITLDGGGTLSAIGTLALNSQVAGTGTLTIGHGRVLLNAANTYAGPVAVNGTLALGRLDAITPASTTFNSGSTFDLNGFDWSAPLAAQGVNVANSAATGVTLSSALTVTDNFGLSGPLHFTGTVAAPGGNGSVTVASAGDVRLDTASGALLGTVSVNSGNLAFDLDALPNLSHVDLTGTSRLTFTGAPRDLALTFGLHLPGTGGDTVGLFNNTSGALQLTTDLALTEGDPLRRSVVLIGGGSDLILAGTLSGEASLTKVGTGNLTLNSTVAAWNTANSGARLGVREGTLTTTTGVLQNRGLVVENTGVLALTDDPSTDLQIRTLDGNGTLDLGSRNLVLNLGNNGAFTGSLLTTGNVTGNVADISHGAPTQTFGSLTASNLTVNFGNLVVTDALNAGFISVYASGAGGSLTTTTNGISTGGGTNLSSYLNLQGEMRLTGGSAVTANSGGITLAGAQARLLDDQGTTDTLSHLATNTGQISLSYGAAVTGGAATFTNTGRVDLGATTWTGLHDVVNQASLSGGFYLSGSVLSVEHFTQLAGPISLSADSTITGTAGGNATANPAFLMTGGQFDAAGTISGGLDLAGGLTRVGAFYTVGTLTATDGAQLNGGARLQWTFDSSGSDHHSLLAVTAGSVHDGVLTVNATSALPVQVDLMSTGSSLPDFDATQSRTWTFATTTDGLANFDSAKFAVNNYDVGAGSTGNFGLVANGNNVDLVYNPSYVYDTTSADITVSTPLAANGPFGGVYTYGANTLTLATANTYTGDTTLNTGTLALGDDHALGSGALRVYGYGSTFLHATGGARTIANAVYLIGSPVIDGADDLSFTGSVTNLTTGSPTLTVTNTGTTTFNDIVLSSTSDAYTKTGRTLTLNIDSAAGLTTVAGVISDGLLAGGKLTKSGGGTLILAGDSTYTGATRVNAGTLQLGNGGTTGSIAGSITDNATLAFNRADTHAYSGNISGTGGVTQNGTGTTLLSGANTYAGTTTVNTGTLQFAATTALANSANLTVASGATAAFNVGGAGEFTAADIDTIKSLGTATTGFTNGSYLGFDTTNATGGLFAYNSDIANPNGGANALGLVKLGTGTLSLGGNNTYSGATRVNAGTLQLGSATALSPNTSLNVATGATFDSNGYAQSFATLNGAGTVNVGGSGIAVTPTGTNSFDGALTGTGGLTMNGTGTLVLNNTASDFSGPVTLSQGTLEIGATGALPTGLNVTMSHTATLNLADHSTTVGRLTGDGQVTLGNATLILAPTGGSASFGGAISGTGGVKVSGGGTVILTGANHYTGATDITSGQLTVNGSLDSGSHVTVGAGGTLGGSGSLGDLTVAGTLAPGNSPGVLHTGDTRWLGGGNYVWQINLANGTAGMNWDQIDVTGTLDFSALSSVSRFTISLESLTAGDTAGALTGFDATHNYSYMLATASAGIVDFATDDFSINTAGFANDLAGGAWSLSSNGYDLNLNFTALSAVPEPATCALFFGLSVLALAAWRKRRAL